MNDLDWLNLLVAQAAQVGEDAEAGLGLAERYGSLLPLPGAGATALRWQALGAVAAADLTAARILEAHADALAILVEAGQTIPEGRWGVFAAEAPDVALIGQSTPTGWTLDGIKPWCSLGASLDCALVTARTDAGRRLFAVDLRQAGVHAAPIQGWVARGLRAVPSGPVRFDHVPARPVGPPSWYLSRAGFAWGGMGVAACWCGGARAVAQPLRAAAAARSDDQLLASSVGAVDVALHAATTVLADAAHLVDRGAVTGPAGEILALRVRSVVAEAAERALTHTAHALGPGPLAFDERHARRVADLELYLRQHHAEHDLAALGRLLTDAPDP